jgi:hypothetical protein
MKDDIYPFCCVRMRYGGKFVIIESETDCIDLDSIQSDEEMSYNFEEKMSDNYEHLKWGIGESITDALRDFWNKYEK